MKLNYGLGKCEKILLWIVAICLVVLGALSVRLCQSEEVGLIQSERIRISNIKINAYELDIKTLQDEISKLEEHNIRLQEQKDKVFIRTLVQIDSISALPFEGKSDFWAEQTARLDTIRERYISRDN